jgi:hypothetical protein
MLRLLLGTTVVAFLALGVGPSWGANPHIPECPAVLEDGTLTMSGKVAGLGNQTKAGTALVVEATATALCVDVATVPPTIVEAQPVTASQTLPPKNGNNKFSVALTPEFLLPCDAPLAVTFVGAEVCDVTHGPDVCCTP